MMISKYHIKSELSLEALNFLKIALLLSKSLFNASLDTLDLLVSTSTKTDQVSPNNKHKTIPLLGNKNSK